MTRSRSGLTVSIFVSMMNSFLAWELTHFLLEHCRRKTKERGKLKHSRAQETQKIVKNGRKEGKLGKEVDAWH